MNKMRLTRDRKWYFQYFYPRPSRRFCCTWRHLVVLVSTTQTPSGGERRKIKRKKRSRHLVATSFQVHYANGT